MLVISRSFGGNPLTAVELILNAAKGLFEADSELGLFIACLYNDEIRLKVSLSAKPLRAWFPSPVLNIEKRHRRIVSGRIEGLKIFGIKKRILANLLHFCLDERESPSNTAYILTVSQADARFMGC